jgi:Flp pilus assembly protein TadD
VKAEPRQPVGIEPDRRNLLPYVLLISITSLTYLNSFRGVFLFDDLNIPGVRSARSFAGPNISRPLVVLSFLANQAISGFDVWSYHLFNLSIHLVAGLALFGVARRTLASPRLGDRFAQHSTPLALTIALIWLIHPLQTESVTYISQRAESLMGMFYILTLYFVIRGANSQAPRRWYLAAVATSAAGMLSKQVMVTAPLVILLYDYLFLSSSLTQALRKRLGLYLGLSLTWIMLAATIIAMPKANTAGFSTTSIGPWDYLKSQPAVVCRYIRLSVWPVGLCLDYRWPKATGAAHIIPYALPLSLLVGATLWGLIRRKPAAFLGVWFFGILAVTSSFIPFADLAFEHRIYLSLAAIAALAVLGARALVTRLIHEPKRLLCPAALFTILILCALTIYRNADYDDAVVMWRDVANKRPSNLRAYHNLGRHLAARGNLDQAGETFMALLRLDPNNAQAHQDLAMTLIQEGRPDDGIDHLRAAVELQPTPDAYTKLGAALANKRRFDEAMVAFLEALAINPDYGPALANRGFAEERQGRTNDALVSFNRALQHLTDAELTARVQQHITQIASRR